MVKWICIALCFLLAGCGSAETFETVCDEPAAPVMAMPRQISVELPGETALPVMENSSGRVYICNDYEIILQTMESGDLEATFLTLSGLTGEELTVVETFADGVDRYEFVWAAAGEGGDCLGRGVVLDDGNYHYCLTVLREAEGREKSQINWDQVVSSFRLV